MAHSKVDCRSLTYLHPFLKRKGNKERKGYKESNSLLPLLRREGNREKEKMVIIFSFLLVLLLISVTAGTVRGDSSDNNKIVYNLSIDGDMDAYIKWSDWSNYVKNGSWWSPGSSIEHHTTINEFVNENGEEFRFLLFNGDMNHKNYGIWEHFSHNGTTILTSPFIGK